MKSRIPKILLIGLTGAAVVIAGVFSFLPVEDRNQIYKGMRNFGEGVTQGVIRAKWTKIPISRITDLQHAEMLSEVLRKFICVDTRNETATNEFPAIFLLDKNLPESYQPNVDCAEIVIVESATEARSRSNSFDQGQQILQISDLTFHLRNIEVSVFSEPLLPEGMVALQGGGSVYECSLVSKEWNCRLVGRIIG